MSRATYLQNVRENQPLIHNMTNQVVANDVANAVLAVGGSPIMAYEEKEIAEIVSISSAVVLNIGTITEPVFQSMLTAGKAANQHNIPLILDPVGVGATSYRKSVVDQLLSQLEFSLIRGNSAEIAALAGEEWRSKGVDAGEGTGSREAIASKVARSENCITAISGIYDVVSNGKKTYKISSGHSLMGQITGSGCMLSSISGTFIGANPQNILESVVSAHIAMGSAGLKAAQRTDVLGPGTFRSALIDELYLLKAADMEMKVEEIDE